VTEAHFGQRVSCPTCGEPFVVPELGRTTPSNTPLPPAGGPAGPGPDSPRWKPSLKGISGLPQGSLLPGRFLLALGLTLVLLARGCDAIGQRAVQRAAAKSHQAQENFDFDWQTKEIKLQDLLSAEESQAAAKQDEKQIADLKTKLSELAASKAKDRTKQEHGAWRDLENNARSATTTEQINAYWRELFFVFASILLAGGLLLVSWTAQGAERWVALVMLAIITISLYIGGIAWIPLPR
jgi:hypothetical protein